jgi:hypothetical protein
MRKHQLIRAFSIALLGIGLMSTVSAAQDELPGDGGGGGAACQNGGPGATSCYVDMYLYQCSVTCNTGYYACCTLAGCSCVKN